MFLAGVQAAENKQTHIWGNEQTRSGKHHAFNGEIKRLFQDCNNTENFSGVRFTRGSGSNVSVSFCLEFRNQLDYLWVVEFSCKKTRRWRKMRMRKYISLSSLSPGLAGAWLCDLTHVLLQRRTQLRILPSGLERAQRGPPGAYSPAPQMSPLIRRRIRKTVD